MNQTQRTYAVAELKRISRSADTCLRDKHTSPEVRLTTEQRIVEFKAGNYTFDEEKFRNSTYCYADFRDCIIFDAESKEIFDGDAYEKQAEPLRKAYREAEHEVMLGDNEKALALITKFSKMTEKLS